MLLGAVADDFTGATDLAGALVRAGLATIVTIGVPDEVPAADAVVVALPIRTVPAADAVAVAVLAAEALRAAGAERLFWKYCSTFDSTDAGNIGPVADGLGALVGATVALVCPAYPANGRTVRDGRLYVDGVPLDQTGMRHHPLTPMTDADLAAVMGRQTPHRVGLVPLAAVRAGAGAVATALARLAADGYRYAVADAETDDDVTALAAAAVQTHASLVTGGAALGGAWATALAHASRPAAPEQPRAPGPAAASGWGAAAESPHTAKSTGLTGPAGTTAAAAPADAAPAGTATAASTGTPAGTASSPEAARPAGAGTPASTAAVAGAAPSPEIARSTGRAVVEPLAGRAVVVAGSCSEATRAQVAAFAQAYPTITLDPEALADGFDPVPAVLAVLEGVAGPVLIGTSAPPTAVARAQAALGRERSAAVVEAALARVAVAVHAAGVRRFVVAGGETAGAVVAALGVRALHIGADLDPGVPRTRAVGLGGDPLELVLKSGNFGAPDLFLRAVA